MDKKDEVLSLEEENLEQVSGGFFFRNEQIAGLGNDSYDAQGISNADAFKK